MVIQFDLVLQIYSPVKILIVKSGEKIWKNGKVAYVVCGMLKNNNYILLQITKDKY